MSRETFFRDDDILPPPPEGAVLLHNREYRVESYHLGPDRLLIQGALRDQKPPGLVIPGDPEPLTIHHMTLVMEIAMPSMTIEAVQTHFPTHPQTDCPTIIDHYDELIGLSIARGFTHRVRELFGGPRGCSHTTALLQAMAPIAMQSVKGMAAVTASQNGDGTDDTVDEADDSWRRLVNTCHVWAEGGQKVELLKKGDVVGGSRTLTVTRRLKELGLE